MLGRPSDGIGLILDGLDGCRMSGCGVVVPFWLAILGELYGHAGQFEEGLKRLAEAEQMIDNTQERWPEAEVYRLRGQLLLQLDDSAAAEASFVRALGVARRQSAKFWELRAAASLARLWRDQGKRAQSADLLSPIYSWFIEGFDTVVLQEAKALLGELGEHAHSRTAGHLAASESASSG